MKLFKQPTLKLALTLAMAGLFYTTVATAFEALPNTAPAPADNPMTDAKVELGKILFFDPRLSIDGTVSCNSCHNVMSSGTDNRAVSVGVAGQKGGRSAPTVWNAAFLSAQFWDGRAATLEDQAKGPILNPIEMGMPDEATVVARLASIPGYPKLFKQAFGGKKALTYDNLAKAIASYERTLITPNSAFDRFLQGEKKAISRRAKSGMKLVEQLGCTGCHSGVNFAGPAMASGQGFYQKFPAYRDNDYVSQYKLADDLGRFEATKANADKHMWRVPSLRNVALTAPYFHNGAVETLDEAVRVMAMAQLNIRLNDSQADSIVAFLNTLTGSFPEQTLPRLPDINNHSVVDIH